jgi:3-hydroxymyristoyl/3-hydroxydecanoyl-(acyl carrier protein) dehydratase
MGAGVFTFRGGSDLLMEKMVAELKRNGVESAQEGAGGKNPGRRTRRPEGGLRHRGEQRPRGAREGGALERQHQEHRSSGSAARRISRPTSSAAQAVRINSSSCQVYLGIRKGESIPHIGDLVFTSETEVQQHELVDFHTTSRTFSVYYPDTRPGSDRYTVVVSLNGQLPDWNRTSATRTTSAQAAPDRGVGGGAGKIHSRRGGQDRLEGSGHAADDRALHDAPGGTSFGTKFEGLKVSMDLSDRLPGLYHAGSVGIIMSGWLGTINYGVITANKIDKALFAMKQAAAAASLLPDHVPSHRPHSAPPAVSLRRRNRLRIGRRPRGAPHVSRRRRLLPGHYPGAPITPGVLLCEAVFQTGALYMARLMAGQGSKDGVPLLAKISDVRFRNPVYPGDTITIEVKKKESLGGFTMMSGHVKCGDTRVLNVDFAVAWKTPEGQQAAPACPISSNSPARPSWSLGVANRKSVAWFGRQGPRRSRARA